MKNPDSTEAIAKLNAVFSYLCEAKVILSQINSEILENGTDMNQYIQKARKI